MWIAKLPAIGLLLLLSSGFKLGLSDDFPSLLTANASIAVILDREYLDNKYEDTLNEVS